MPVGSRLARTGMARRGLWIRDSIPLSGRGRRKRAGSRCRRRNDHRSSRSRDQGCCESRRVEPGRVWPAVALRALATIAHLPLADQSLDGILCSSVLEYVPDPAACLAEFARVLRSGGLLLVSVANRNSLVRRAQVRTHRLGRLLGQRWCTFLDYSHNEYAAAAFRALLKQHGFATANVIPFGSPIPQWLQRLDFGGSLLAFCAVRE